MAAASFCPRTAEEEEERRRVAGANLCVHKEACKQHKCVGQKERKWYAAKTPLDCACTKKKSSTGERKRRGGRNGKTFKKKTQRRRSTNRRAVTSALVVYFFPPQRREVAHGSPHASWPPCGQRCPLDVISLSSRTCRRKTADAVVKNAVKNPSLLSLSSLHSCSSWEEMDWPSYALIIFSKFRFT